MRRSPMLLVAALFMAGPFAGCQTVREAYYDTSESWFGYSKRERLVDRVQTARNEQEEAKQTFVNALEQFRSVVNFNGGDLEAMYNKLNDQYRKCESRAGSVKTKVQDVKNVGVALFEEWEDEIGQMSDPQLKSSNASLRQKTLDSYNELITRMDSAAATMDPVLQKLKDRVLYLKGNLNAQAIASLKGTEIQLGQDIDGLIREMEAAIKEADEFIAANQAPK